MSRSFRKTPICGNASCRSERPFKRIWHRGYRSRTRQQVRQGLEPLRIREYGRADVWSGNKDGKHWFGIPGRHRYYDYAWRLHRLESFEAYDAWLEQITAQMMRK